MFAQFSVQDTINWFGQHGITLKTEADGRMFPYSNDSQTIIDCFLKLAGNMGIEIMLQTEVIKIQKQELGFSVSTSRGLMEADALICALGGHNKTSAYKIVQDLGHRIDDPIPSLFTLNLPGEAIKQELQGVSVPLAEVKIKESKLNYAGPVLITHWGLSGPAVLKLSAFAAKEFFDTGYKASVLVNWAYPLTINEITNELKLFQKEKAKALPYTNPQFQLPKRLWEFLCSQSGMDNARPWAEIGNKPLQQLANNIGNSSFNMEGKTTFKEEFVTCGGVNLKEIDFKTMQSKLMPGLFFCGEVLNIDGITGGFNFQSAWSTAWICAKNISSF